MEFRRDFLKHSFGVGLGVATGSPLLSARAEIASMQTQPKAMIVGTTSPTSIRSGLDAMKKGGTAADAVLTTALSQIAMCAGCWVSYAGRMTATYFDAESSRVHTLNACYDAPRNETEPMSIPAPPTPSGRSVLVPGFMAGVAALHEKFGRRSFKQLFEPAIEIAGDGITMTRNLARLIRGKQKVLTRYEEGRMVFNKNPGELFAEGDQFKQPLLANTLQQVAEQGSQYMYEGDWGRRFVKTVQREGGKISLEDMKQYAPTWSIPLTVDLGDGLSVSGLPTPNRGCPIAIACLNLARHAEITKHGHYTKSIESLRRILDIETAGRIINWDHGRKLLSGALGKDNLSRDDFADAELGVIVWKLIESKNWQVLLDKLNPPQPNTSEHSDAVVAVDERGNVASILHTINTAGWGMTGLFVDGVSIPDSAANQQSGVALAGPGGRVADHGPPMIATNNGRPFLAGSATGSGNVNASWQNFVDVLMYGMKVQDAADSANFYRRTFETNGLDADLVQQAKAAGIPINVKPQFGGFEMGFWAGIGIDPNTGVMNAGKIRKLDGIAVQY